MVTLEVTAGEVRLHVVGADQLWSFKSELSIPVAHVVDVKPATQEAKQWFHGLRAPGTSIPGVITAGTYYDGSGCAFWDVHNADNAIEIALRDDRYARLIVEVEDPAAAIALIRKTLQAT